MLIFIVKHSGVWAMPFITARIIDVVADPDNKSLSEIWLWVGLSVVIFLQNVPMHYLFVYRISLATRNMEIKLRSAMARRLQYLSMNFYYRSSTGQLQTKLLRDVEVIQEMTMQLAQIIPSATVTFLFALIVTAVRVPQFLVFFLLTVPISVFLVSRMRQSLQTGNRDFRQEVETMSSSLIDMIHLLPITRAHGVEDVALSRIENRLKTVRQTGIKLDLVNALFGAYAWVAFRLFEILCLATAAYAAYTQVFPITVGDVIMLTAFFTNLTNSILQLSTIVPLITKGFESIYSIGDILESPDIEENEGKPTVDHVEGNFRFESIYFSYPDTTDSSIYDFSLDVKKGETIAIVGPSGAGKSTLLNLIIGFIRPSQGEILLDGQDMNQLDLRSYRKFVSVVPQHTVLFEGSLRENVLYGQHQHDDDTVLQALRDANATDLLDDLPDGLDTQLGENAMRLSGGQRQRVAIARAIIRNPRVLILDEATSALDTITESKIQQALERLMKGRTTFVVAHRLSTIQKADRIIVMENGRIVEIGTHHDLLARQGHYAAMHEAIALPQ